MLRSINLNKNFQYFLRLNIQKPTLPDILLSRIIMCAIVLFQDQQSLFRCQFIRPFAYQKDLQIISKLYMFETEKTSFQNVVEILVNFLGTHFLLFAIVCLYLLQCSLRKAPLCTTIFFSVENMFKSCFACLLQFI